MNSRGKAWPKGWEGRVQSSNYYKKNTRESNQYTLHGKIKAAQSIASQGISTALQHDSTRSISVHDLLHDFRVNLSIRLVINSVLEGKVYRVMFAFALAYICHITRAGEKVSVFVERDSHDSVCWVKCFFYTIAMVVVNINIQDSLVISVCRVVQCHHAG